MLYKHVYTVAKYHIRKSGKTWGPMQQNVFVIAGDCKKYE